MPDSRLRLTRFRVPATLPPDAWALLRGSAQATPAWYDSVTTAGLGPAEEPAFLAVSGGARTLMVWPMREGPDGMAALTTPYTSLWQPLPAPGMPPAQLRDAAALLGAGLRKYGTVRLDCLAATDPIWRPLRAGLADAGLRLLAFDHFGNWHADTAGQSWERYLAARPGALREAIRRRGKRLAEAGGTCRIVTGGAGLAPAIAAYEAIYAKSWKEPEPFPAFMPALMRAAAAAGMLRLGLLEVHGVPVAAQLWLVCGNWAGVLKLAHDEAQKALSPGTVLTAHVIRHLLDVEHMAELDFGRGDDAYKKDWAPLRRQRSGMVLANPLHPRGAVAVGRQWLRGWIKRR